MEVRRRVADFSTDDLPNGCHVVEAFIQSFSPERVPAVILSPCFWNEPIEWSIIRPLIATLRTKSLCEVMTADATDRTANGLMYADFF